MNKKFEMFMNVLIYLLVFVSAQFFVLSVGLVIFSYMARDLVITADIVNITKEMYIFIGQYSPVIYIAAFIVSILIYYVVFKARKKNIIKEAGFSKIPFYKVFILVFVGIATNIIIDFILPNIMNYFNIEQTFSEYEILMERVLSSNNTVLLLLSIGILFPILEEIVFRGFIFNELRKNISLTKAIGIQAFLFGILHINPVQGSYAFILGLLFAYVYIWTESIWAPIVFHIVINSYTVMATRFPQLSENNIPQLVTCIFVIVIGMSIIHKTKVKNIQ